MKYLIRIICILVTAVLGYIHLTLGYTGRPIYDPEILNTLWTLLIPEMFAVMFFLLTYVGEDDALMSLDTYKVVMIIFLCFVLPNEWQIDYAFDIISGVMNK